MKKMIIKTPSGATRRIDLGSGESLSRKDGFYVIYDSCGNKIRQGLYSSISIKDINS